jgi:DNA-binding transcriptional LysR family regulator
MDANWRGIELRHLAALEAIEEERSFRGAADRLGYVQSAVSQQIAMLEQLVGVRLVERSRGHTGVKLTESGAILLHHARDILAALRAARADLDAIAGAHGNTVRVGAFQSAAARILPRVLSQLTHARPDLTVETAEASNDADLFDAVAEGRLDCAFAELPLADGPFKAVELMVDPCVLVVQAESPLAARPHPPTLEEIAQLPLAYPTWRMTDLINDHFRSAGLRPIERFRLESNAAAQAVVSAGLAAAIMPQLAVDDEVAATKAIDLTGILPSRTLVLYWHANRLHGAALATFVEATRQICRQLAMSSPNTEAPGEVLVGRFPRLSTDASTSDPDGDASAAATS